MRKLDYELTSYDLSGDISKNIPFNSILGERNGLADLAELYCNLNMGPEFFHQLSQICHNLILLAIYNIEGYEEVSNELKELVGHITKKNCV